MKLCLCGRHYSSDNDRCDQCEAEHLYDDIPSVKRVVLFSKGRRSSQQRVDNWNDRSQSSRDRINAKYGGGLYQSESYKRRHLDD